MISEWTFAVRFEAIHRGLYATMLRHFLALLLFTVSLAHSEMAHAQQFAGDNQWVAPAGVSTLVGSVGEDYSSAILVGALIPEWEFNAMATYYYDDPRNASEDYVASTFWAKHRLFETDDGTEGYSVQFGTGLLPHHVEEGSVTDAFKTYFVHGTATYAFADNKVLLDFVPGVIVNLDQDDNDETAWGFTYVSRLAVYDIIPQSAIVGEVFGTAGEAFAEPSYRFGVRWESENLVIAATYSDAFDGSGGAGFELGIIFFTQPRFCIRGCRGR